MQVEELVERIVTGVTAHDPVVRMDAAASVVDGIRLFSDEHVNRLARALADAAIIESDEEALETELRLLDTLAQERDFERDILGPVLTINVSALGESEQEYMTDLRAYYEGRDEDL